MRVCCDKLFCWLLCVFVLAMLHWTFSSLLLFFVLRFLVEWCFAVISATQWVLCLFWLEPWSLDDLFCYGTCWYVGCWEWWPQKICYVLRLQCVNILELQFGQLSGFAGYFPPEYIDFVTVVFFPATLRLLSPGVTECPVGFKVSLSSSDHSQLSWLGLKKSCSVLCVT